MISNTDAITSSQPKNNIEATVAVTDRATATTPSASKPMPNARNHPQYWTTSCGICTAKVWVSAIAISPLRLADAQAATTPWGAELFPSARDNALNGLGSKPDSEASMGRASRHHSPDKRRNEA